MMVWKRYEGLAAASWLSLLFSASSIVLSLTHIEHDDMGFTTKVAAAAALALSATTTAAPIVSNDGTSLTLIYQNNLNTTDDANHIGASVLDPMSASAGAAACASIGESLLTRASIESHSDDFLHSLAYLSFAGHQGNNQQYQIQDGAVTASSDARD
jgi:hypothetical protein